MSSSNKDSMQRSAQLPAPLSSKLAPAVRVLAWVRVLSSQNLATALSVHPVTARRYLRQLHKLDLTRKQAFSFADQGGTGWLHSLAPAGARAASSLLGHPTKAVRKGQLRSPLVDHRLDTTSALCGLIAALSKQLIDVRSGRPLHSQFQAPISPPRYEPDAYLAFRVKSEDEEFLRHAFIEVDRSTETKSTLEEKLAGLHRYYATGAYEKDFKTERLVVLFTVPGEGRIPSIMEAVKSVRPCVRVFVKVHENSASPETALGGWLDCLTSAERNLLDKSSSSEEEAS